MTRSLPDQLPDAAAWARRCSEDGEFTLAARHWNGGVTLAIDDDRLTLRLDAGVPTAAPLGGEAGVITLAGDAATWARVLAPQPPRFHNDVMANISLDQGLSRAADPVVFAQYYPAVMRAIELLRPAEATSMAMRDEARPAAQYDAPVGRYIHLDLGGHDHRIYFEEAGQGIPLLLQHTAGCHGSQWRHLFEVPEITEHFRLIAYDLPYHGKSIPPVTKAWWAERYDLEGEFLRSVPLELSRALELTDPVFMGCSVGGLLALDLAARHADAFRAVISVEGALKVEGDLDDLGELWHPQVSNEYKARLMDGLMSPTSPKPYRKETSWVYSAGWPPVFLGDLYYYIEDFDLRDAADRIDTNACGVHILSGEYDWSGTAELGRAAQEAISGATWVEMKGVGHFPMSENPIAFVEYLLPILDRLRAA
jgi:pimeloyl-ACP methyl ester carboxylesterase